MYKPKQHLMKKSMMIMLYLAAFLTAFPISSLMGQTSQGESNATKSTKGLSGDIYVGSDQTYTSFTRNDGSGLFAALNAQGMDGNITVYVTTNITETGEVALTAADGTYTLTIKPSAAQERMITGSISNSRGVLHLQNAHQVTIDGSFMGSGNYLTFLNSYTAGNSIGLQISGSSPTGSSNVTIRHCNIGSGKSTSGAYALHIGGANPATSGDDLQQITIESNQISSAYYGIYIKGENAAEADGITISGNTFGKPAALIGNTAILVQYAQNVEILDNNITNFSGNVGHQYGIQLGTGVTYTSVLRNSIYDIVGNLTGAGSKAVFINTGHATSNIIIANNIIYNVKGYGSTDITNFSGGANIGIAIYGTTGTVGVYYNSVYLYGRADRTQPTLSAAMYVGDQCTAINVRNNLFYNQLVNYYNASAKAYALYVAGLATAFESIDYNVYYVSGTQGVLGFLSADLTSLGALQAATADDGHSLATDPAFKSLTELQPLSTSPVLGAGVPVPGITTDINGLTRDATNPSMGAYEEGFVLPAVDWCNLQSPSNLSQKEGLGLNVYARVYEDGVTNGAGQGAGITAWIGYSTENTNPITWSHWIVATYNTDYGNNDEYVATLPASLPEGIYYFASRFLIEEGNFQYGGYSSGGGHFWDGTSYVSGQLNVQNNTISWANLQHPENLTILEGENLTAYGRLYAEEVTTQNDSSVAIQAWIGWSAENTNPSTWSNWVVAYFNTRIDNNHEYKATIHFNTEGTYYYASRFMLCEDDIVYGGFNSGGGGFWDETTNVSGVLTVNPLVVNLPYTQDFEGLSEPLLAPGWRAEDVNADGQEWYTDNGSARIDYNAFEATDDWLFSPGINMSAGVSYYVSFSYAALDASYPEKLELKYGNQRNAAAMGVTTLFSNTNITNTSSINVDFVFEAPTTDTYYFGWHCFSNADMYGVLLDDFSIEMVNDWSGSVSQLWSEPQNWTSGSVPNSASSIAIRGSNQVYVDLDHAVCNNLFIGSSAKLIIQPNKGLEVHNNLNNEAEEAGILIVSDATGTGSLLHWTAGTKGVFQRYIERADWENHQDGWHFISSPVFLQPISGDWTPTEAGDDYDFFLWDGENVEWLNQKDPENGITHFMEGISYLVAYEQSRSHVFSGTINVDYVDHNLPINKDSWLPIGNPYATALIWNNGHWMLDGFADIAKVWRRETQSYVDIHPGDIIPATNGFMGFGQSIGGVVVNLQMSIPPYARTISNNPSFYKSSSWPTVYLTAYEADNNSSQESCFILHQEASNFFNMHCDSKFNPGYAPEFYSIKGGEAMSTYALRDFSDQTVEMAFVPNQATHYRIEFDTERSTAQTDVWLTDQKTGAIQNLSNQPVYHFQSLDSDNPNRFLIHFSTVGQLETPTNKKPDVFLSHQELYILNLSGKAVLHIYDLQGRPCKSFLLTENNTSVPVNDLPAAAYIVRIADDQGVASAKIIVP